MLSLQLCKFGRCSTISAHPEENGPWVFHAGKELGLRKHFLLLLFYGFSQPAAEKNATARIHRSKGSHKNNHTPVVDGSVARTMPRMVIMPLTREMLTRRHTGAARGHSRYLRTACTCQHAAAHTCTHCTPTTRPRRRRRSARPPSC